MDLPEEVIVEILLYLDVKDLFHFAESVPKLTEVIHHPALWKYVDLHRLIVFTDQLIESLNRNATKVISLSMNSPSFFFMNRDRMQNVMSRMCNIVFLDISMCNILESMDFLVHMQALEHFVMDCVTILTTEHRCVSYTPLPSPGLSMQLSTQCKQG